MTAANFGWELVNDGIQVYDLTKPTQPKAIDHYYPSYFEMEFKGLEEYWQDNISRPIRVLT